MHQPPRRARRALRLLVFVLILGMAAQVVQAAEPQNTQGFRKAVTLAGIREHQAALQAIADGSSTTRVSGTPGFDASVQYVFDRLTAAGYAPWIQAFPFIFDADNTPPALAQVSPLAASYVDGVDFFSMTYSGNGNVTAPVWAVDLVVPSPAPNANTSGCEATDFAGFPAGAIALMQRGTCPFGTKALNALAAGAGAAIIFNEGNPGRTAGFQGTLGSPVALATVGTSFAVGDALRGGAANGPTGVIAQVRVDRASEERTAYNVIADTPWGDADNIVLVGAHLDSVSRGPGINDNGSGSAAILEIAEVYAQQGRDHRNKVRFAWWGAEEFGLLGSEHYVATLPQEEIGRIRLNLNFDMIGSPNFVRFVYDGNNSAFPVGPGAAAGPPGSGAIEAVFEQYFASQGLAYEATPFSGRSDYGPFIAVGIPAGGLFTGAEGIKTAEQAAIFGGTAGIAYDPCYHLACDTISNNSDAGLDQMADAAAHAVIVLAKWNFGKTPLSSADPQAEQSARIMSPQEAANVELHPAHEHEGEAY